ncbi:hypothetical protein [Zymomonas mobilis]|uniref:hypothetical protein n=1 Tax=Zymomonas mobilis TaxID=542 RepID=UPI0011832954|nr:hypothetical protein [Zymomonas mobilis]
MSGPAGSGTKTVDNGRSPSRVQVIQTRFCAFWLTTFAFNRLSAHRGHRLELQGLGSASAQVPGHRRQ